MIMNQQFQTTDQAIDQLHHGFPLAEVSHDTAVEDSPCCILLVNTGLQIEFEPGQPCAIQVTSQSGHHMQLLNQLE